MLKSIYNFEMLQQLKRPFIWVICLLMFCQGMFYMHHSGEFYANDETYANASAIFFTVFAGVGYVGFIMTAIIAGTVITKDIQSRFSSILFTTSASESGYFWGRYFAGYTIMLGLNLFYLLGAFSYSFLPIKNLGPINLPALLAAVIYILIPNTFILFTFCFSAATITKNIKSSYMASMFVMLFMIFAVSMHDFNRTVSLLDPTSFGVLLDELEHMSPVEKNAYMPTGSFNLIGNRLAWIFLAGAALILSRKTFSFKQFSKTSAGKKQKQLKEKELVQAAFSENQYSRSVFKPKFSTALNWRNVFSLSFTEFKSVTAPVGFKIFLGLLSIMYICYIAVWQQQYYSAAPTLPVTVEITNITIALSFYFQLFVIINTVELLFRNQTTEFWKIADALPIPSWVTVLSKINAMLLVSFFLCLCLIILGIAVQSAKGYYDFELLVYFNEVILRWMPKYAAYILLCAAIAGISGNKFVTHGISILVLVVTIILHEIGVLEQQRFAFTFSPGSLKYTDMNGISFFGTANLWYSLYWISLVSALVSIGLLVWTRGLASPLNKRLKLKGKTTSIFIMLLLVFSGVFAYASHHINQIVYIENKFSTLEEDRNDSASYEKAFKRYENSVQPQIQYVDLKLNIDPESRSMEYNAVLKLHNTNTVSIDTLHIEWIDFMVIDDLKLAGNSLKLIQKDEVLRHAIYLLEKPILSDNTVCLIVKAHKQYKGFSNDDPQLDLAFNGSVVDESLFPFIGGYDSRRGLNENKYRTEYGLPKMSSSLPEPGNLKGINTLFASTQSQYFTYDFTISTAEKQSIVMPGILLKKWNRNQKNYYHYKSEVPVPYHFNILSAQYDSKIQNIKVDGKQIAIEIYHHPQHSYNTKAWIESAEEALQFLSQYLGEYPYQKLIIAEKPRYDDQHLSAGGMIVLSENHGWIADIRREEDRDYLRFVCSQLIAEQYFQQGHFSRVQGYPFLTKSLPRYMALAQMQQLYSKTAIDKFLKKNHDKYLAGKALAGIQEKSVLLSDENQDYIFNNGALEVLYETGNKIGNEKLLNTIGEFYKKSVESKSNLSATDWYNDLLKTVPADKIKWIKDQYTVQ